jgi:electron transfer flavoprotein alpha subunit
MLAESTAEMGAQEVFAADSAVLKDYRPEAYADVLSKLVGDLQPQVVLFPTTGRGRELAGMLAIDLGAGVIPDAVALEVIEGSLVATRPVYGGKAIAKVQCTTELKVITVRSRIYAVPEKPMMGEARIVPVDINLDQETFKTQVLENKEGSGGVSLSDAAIVVTGGRGVSTSKGIVPPEGLDAEAEERWRAEQGFMRVRELAGVLNAAVGASRAAVDAGYIPYEYQVGQTGKIVSPDIYIACGVSGAIQHLAGMRNSKLIVAINEESDAPIFKYAHIGVIGDLHAVLPALTEQFKARQ